MNLSYYRTLYIYIYIYIYYKYIIYKFCAFCLLQHCRNTYTRWLHWFHIHIIFFCCFYQLSKIIFCSSWWTSNRFQTLKSSYWRCSIKNPVFKNLAILIGKVANLLQRVFNTVVFLWILRNFLKTSLLKDICERLPLNSDVEKAETYSETVIGDAFRAHSSF